MKLASAILVTFAALCILAQPVLARTFYLKSGEEIDYQKSWKKNGRIYVLINRDTLIDFAPDEVDLRKTYHHGVSKKRVRHHHGKRHKGVSARHGKGLKSSTANKAAPQNANPESPAAGKAVTRKPVVKAPAAMQQKDAGKTPVNPAKPVKMPVHAPGIPVKNAPAGR